MPAIKSLFAAAIARANDAAVPGRSDAVMGLVWVTVSMALLAGLAAFSRLLMIAGMHSMEVVFLRNLCAFLVFSPILFVRGPALFQSDNLKLYAWRCGFALFSMQAWFYALSLIPLGELTAISFLSPLFGTLAAVALLGEKVRARRWTALAIGFLGAMIILRPSGTGFGIGQTCALASAMTSGVIAILVKQLTARDDPSRIVFMTNALMTPVSLVPALFVWQWPTTAMVPALLGLGVCAVLGHLTLVRGYAATDASLALTFEFTRLPFATAIAYLAFGEQIDRWTWIGALVIFASTVYITRREAKLRAAAAIEAAARRPAAAE